jgi:hypothetical protein
MVDTTADAVLFVIAVACLISMAIILLETIHLGGEVDRQRNKLGDINRISAEPLESNGKVSRFGATKRRRGDS